MPEIDLARRPHRPKRPHRRRLVIQVRPDLPQEVHRRTLPVRTGHRRDHRRLARPDVRRNPRQHGARIVDLHSGNLPIPLPRIGQDRNCARLDRLGNVVAAILQHALQRNEQESLLHAAAVRRHAGNLNRGRPVNQLVESHSAGVSISVAGMVTADTRGGSRTGSTSSIGAARPISRPAIAAAVCAAVRDPPARGWPPHPERSTRRILGERPEKAPQTTLRSGWGHKPRQSASPPYRFFPQPHSPAYRQACPIRSGPRRASC